MRVSFVCDSAPPRNAIGNHLAHQVRWLRERQAEVHVFVQSASLHPDLADCAQVVHAVDAEGPVHDVLAGSDLVIFQYTGHYPLLDYLPLLAGGKPKLAIDYHGVTPPSLWNGPNRETLEHGIAQRGLVWCADAVIVHSAFMCDEIVEATGFPAERVAILPLAVEMPVADASPARWKERLGCAGKPVLLFVGRLAANKRAPLLIEALVRLPEAHAVIIGAETDVYAAEADRCKDLARTLGVANRLHLLGQVGVDALAEAYRGADVLVMPSLHEGFCVPVIEAMACGLPVVAARTTALPETVGPAGLTFAPDDVDDMVNSIARVLAAEHVVGPASLQFARRFREGVSRETAERGSTTPVGRTSYGSGARDIAIVSFRFGPDIVGGAETSLRTMAKALTAAGHHIEVFTTCTHSGHDWSNELPAGTVQDDGLTVHRFPIDAHDKNAHHASLPALREKPGQTSRAEEDVYLRHSIHSTALIEALRDRVDALDAVITGPYLLGLTHDIAREFPGKTLLLPCFHEEPFAHLDAWRRTYPRVGGMLFHTPEEQELSQGRLGLNHPHGGVVGAHQPIIPATTKDTCEIPYIVYCGRYSCEKDMPLLLEWIARFQQGWPGRFEWLFLGQGDVEVPKLPGVRDLGRVNEERKRSILAGAAALVQLSRHESLSLVALEAWAQGTPVLVRQACAVLAGQVSRAQGGKVVDGFDDFAAALTDLWENPAAWKQRGEQGRRYVRDEYAVPEKYVERITQAIDGLRVPLAEHMRRQGLAWARRLAPKTILAQFGAWLEKQLEAVPRARHECLEITPQRAEHAVNAGARSLLIPVRLSHRGSHAHAAQGVGRTVLCSQVWDAEDVALPRVESPLPGLLMPGQQASAAVLLAPPGRAGRYRATLWAECRGREIAGSRTALVVRAEAGVVAAGTCAAMLRTVEQTLAEAHRRQRLPDDYVDVTQGRCTRLKRWLKRKLLGNFKVGYVDVLSRQQTRVNQELVAAVQQLAECCATLDHAVRVLQARLEDGANRANPAECANSEPRQSAPKVSSAK